MRSAVRPACSGIAKALGRTSVVKTDLPPQTPQRLEHIERAEHMHYACQCLTRLGNRVPGPQPRPAEKNAEVRAPGVASDGSQAALRMEAQCPPRRRRHLDFKGLPFRASSCWRARPENICSLRAFQRARRSPARQAATQNSARRALDGSRRQSRIWRNLRIGLGMNS